MLPTNPKVGDIVFSDKTVMEVGVTVPVMSTGIGPFTNCLKTAETDGDIVYIAPSIGDVKKEYAKEIGGFELKEHPTSEEEIDRYRPPGNGRV